MPGKILSTGCADCGEAAASLEIRKRRLCQECFIKYVHSKVLKRMESYRFKNLQSDQKRRLLLPVSGGLSSSVLLQILDAQLRKQISSRNRTAYNLVVVHIMTPGEEVDLNPPWLRSLKDRFPLHTHQAPVSLNDLLTLDPGIDNSLRNIGLRVPPDRSPAAQMEHIISSAKSVTALSELGDLFLMRLLVAYAKQHDCEAILWGHSDSRLAAKALAGVAKGRGGNLPFEICDGMNPWKLYFNYPLRDLFQTELSTYADVLGEQFAELIKEYPMKHLARANSIRQTSIDDLLTNYIVSLGEKYPSIMANVVRTVSKLQTQQNKDETSQCIVCGMPIAHPTECLPSDKTLCYACARTREDIGWKVVED